MAASTSANQAGRWEGTLAPDDHPFAQRTAAMAVKVYLGTASGAPDEITYDDADAFSVTSGGYLLIQRQHSGAQKDLAVFAPSAWRHAEVVQQPRPGSR
jgi:hypothetical protein